MDRRLIHVRALSYAAAGAIVACALVAAALYRVQADVSEGPPAIAIPAFVDSPHQIEATLPPPRHPSIGTPSLVFTQGEHDNSLRLWRYGQHNEIVFSYAEQFDRCNEARRKHIDQADCPSSRETRAYVLEPTADAPLVLAYRRY
jgi:hypothetical protein